MKKKKLEDGCKKIIINGVSGGNGQEKLKKPIRLPTTVPDSYRASQHTPVSELFIFFFSAGCGHQDSA